MNNRRLNAGVVVNLAPTPLFISNLRFFRPVRFGFMARIVAAAMAILPGLVCAQEDTVKIAVTLSPEQQAEAEYNKGLEALGQRDYNTAAELFTRMLVARPGFDKALANRAIAYSNLLRHNEALADINLAIGANPGNAEYFFNKSLIFSGAGLRDSQDVALDQTLRLNGQHADAAYYKGLLAFERGEYDKSIGYYGIAIAARANNPLAYNDRGSAKRAKGDLAGSIDDYRKAVSLDSGQAYLHNNLGSAYRMNGNFREAVDAYSTALRLDPKYLMAMINRGYAHYEQGKYDAAKSDFEEALKVDPKNSQAYNNLASIAIRQQDYKKAKELTTRAIALNERNGAAWYNRGIARQMLREEEGCCEDWKKASELGVAAAKSYVFSACLD
jgi:tetratricopeptide (TPR) repeat protein